jgi:hypothetical protein
VQLCDRIPPKSLIESQHCTYYSYMTSANRSFVSCRDLCLESDSDSKFKNLLWDFRWKGYIFHTAILHVVADFAAWNIFINPLSLISKGTWFWCRCGRRSRREECGCSSK